MAYFPFMIDIEGKKCLVAGGGSIALHKVKILTDFGVHIKVTAPRICEALQELAKRCVLSIELAKREFHDQDIAGMDFVVAATDDERLNLHISDLCRQQNIPVNAVDMKEACSFIFPAIIRDKDLLIAISTGGLSPAAAVHIKKRIRDCIPDFYGEMIETIGEYRNYILTHADTARERKEIFIRLLEYGDAHEGRIPEAVMESFVAEKNRGL